LARPASKEKPGEAGLCPAPRLTIVKVDAMKKDKKINSLEKF
jgi:hypothetical protein